MSGEFRGRGRSGRAERPKDPRSAPYPRPESERPQERPGPSVPRPQAGESRSLGRIAGRSRARASGSVPGSGGKSRGEERGQGDGGIGGQRYQRPPEKIEGSEEYGGERKFQSSDTGSDVGSRGGGGDETFPSQRPGGRLQRQMKEIVETKPETCATKKGVTGSPVMLTTNYFDVKSIPNWVLYQYVVSFDIDEPQERVKKAWLNKHKGEALKSAYIFDGNHLYTYQRLTNKVPDVLKLETVSREEKTVHIDIKFVQEVRRGHAAYLQVFNVLIRRCLSNLNLHLVQRNYFDSAASVRLIQHYLEIWPGYVTNIRQFDGGIMMCTKITHKVMRTDTAFDVLRDCTAGPDYKRDFQQAMIGAVVLTDYTNKTYQIADVDFSKNPMSTFVTKDKETTFVDYYRERYGLNIVDLKQPLLATRKIDRAPKGAPESQRSTREILLVPELCRMTGLSKNMIDNKQLMKDMANITRVSPQQRIERLEGFNNRLQTNPQVVEEFRSWGLEVSRKLKTVQGRVLPPETIQAGNGKTFTSGRDYDWTVPLRSSSMFSNGILSCWVFITSQRLTDIVEKFLPCLNKAAAGMHIRLPPPFIMTTRSENASEIVDVIEKALATYNPDLIAFGFSNDRPDRYSAVKRKCCVDRGVVSQVILSRSMTSKGVMSIATKIAIQIHAKTGGVPWSIPIPTDKCMVVGFDVCHDSVSKSVGAMVASTSPNMTTWFSSVNQHSSREEISFFLANDIYKALVRYLERNKVLPARLIVYRDGVGEGQVVHVLEHEVNVLKEKLSELYGGDTWKMTYIIVTKRVNTRLFFNGRNPTPGTIVDDDITQPERYDFYLVSQSVRQGTVTPTLYNIISDNSKWSPDIMQRFTYKLTHLYFNSSSPVQVPAPCQYAHKLAFLTNQALRSGHHPNLDERLFFL